MVYLLALAASLSNALTSVLQRMGVEDAPRGDTLRLRLLAYAFRRRVWLAGLGFMILSFVAQAAALHMGRLTEVQPVLTTELLFLVLILVVWFRYAVGWREWTGAVAAAGGLAGFLLFSSPRGGNFQPTAAEWVEVGVPCVVVTAMAVMLARRGPRWWRASMFGVGAAIGYAFAAACTKEVTGYVAGNWVSMFWHWETYGLAASGAVAVFLTQNAYHAGPIAASQSTIVLVDPLASILIGVGLFGDDLRTGGAWGPLEALSLLVLFSGALMLVHSPVVSGTDVRHERLSARSRSLHHGASGEQVADPTGAPCS
ncbi:MAG: DMT family transporter [Acidimicrobiales bacterium]